MINIANYNCFEKLLVDLTWLEHATSSLQGTLSPIEIQAQMELDGDSETPTYALQVRRSAAELIQHIKYILRLKH